MASLEIAGFLAPCPAPESGCFASDPGALESMLYFDDGGIRTDLSRVATASTDAAVTGIPFEETTYKPVKIVATGGRINFGAQPARRFADFAEDSSIDAVRLRVAKCAYACGMTAIGCPLRTPVEIPPEPQKQYAYPEFDDDYYLGY